MAGGKVWGVVVPLLVTSMGVPLAIRNPQIQLNKLAQPQASAVTTVAMIPIVLFCIFLLRVYFCFAIQQFDLLGKSCWAAKTLASQLCSDFVLQPFHNLIADRRSFRVGHRFIGLI